MKQRQKCTNGQNFYEKSWSSLIDFRPANNSVLLYLSQAYTIFRYSESMAPSIGAREIDELPKAFMAELLVTKQGPNPCDQAG